MLKGPRYYAFDGCSTSTQIFRDDPPGYYNGRLEVAQIVCCTVNGDNSCSRKESLLACRSGSNNEIKVTWEEARRHCEAVGMRLCNSQLELNQCCGTGCDYDNLLVWSSVKEGISLLS